MKIKIKDGLDGYLEVLTTPGMRVLGWPKNTVRLAISLDSDTEYLAAYLFPGEARRLIEALDAASKGRQLTRKPKRNRGKSSPTRPGTLKV